MLLLGGGQAGFHGGVGRLQGGEPPQVKRGGEPVRLLLALGGLIKSINFAILARVIDNTGVIMLPAILITYQPQSVQNIILIAP